MNTSSFPYLAMVFTQFVLSGGSITMKIAFANGLHPLVFVVYRHLISMILFCPLAFVFERKERPRLTLVMTIKIFVLSSLGSTIHITALAAGLTYTSPTVASALNCITPSLTFLLAVLLRMEKVKIRSSKGQAKVYGTIICMAGTLLITFWRGGFQLKGLVNKPLIDIYTPKPNHASYVHQNWVKGAALISASKVSLSFWLIFQGMVHKMYPAPLSMSFMICIFASLQSSFFALIFARDANQWKLEWDVKLFTIVYGGLVVSGLTFFLLLWTIGKKGPVFAGMFIPLQLPIVGIFSAIAFNERLHVGSLIGAFIIIVGLYCVLWGKSKDSLEIQKSEIDVEKDDKTLEIVANHELQKSETDVEKNNKALEIVANDGTVKDLNKNES